MRLISALAAGVRGAENGSFEAFTRGTSSSAAVYADFEGTTSLASYNLDESGGTTAYVAGLTDVRVYDSEGVLVRKWTEGDRADAIEVVSQAFTGTDYGTALSAVSKPISLASLFALWCTQNGGSTAIDWKVLANGVLDTLPNHLGGLTGIFRNVKAPAYGAVGNGIADDSTAIQNAINAATGGIVLFPDGDYNINATTLTLAADSRVMLLGMGGGASRIICDGTQDLLNIGRTSANQRGLLTIAGLGFQNSANGTNNLIKTTGNGFDLLMIGCHLGSASFGNGTNFYVSVAAPTARLTILGCTFDIYSAGQTAFHVVATSGQALTFALNHIRYSSGSHTVPCLRLNSGKVLGNTFDVSAVTSGTVTLLNDLGTQAAADCLVVAGNRCTNNNGGTIRALAINAPARIIEFANDWTNADFAIATSTALPSELYGGMIGAREGRSLMATADGASVAVNPNYHASITITRSTGTAVTANFTAPHYPGMHGCVTWRNTHATDPFDITGVGVAGSSLDSEGWATVTAQQSFTWHIESVEKAAGGYAWVIVGCSMSAVGTI